MYINALPPAVSAARLRHGLQSAGGAAGAAGL